MVTEEKIWEYLDGSLNESDRHEVEYAIANDSNAAFLYKEASAINILLTSQSVDQPSMAFTGNVMRSIRPRFEYIPAAKVSTVPLLVSALSFLIILMFATAMLWEGHTDISYSYHINTHFINMGKLAFILIDSILLVLFIEQWLYSKRRHLS